ncbi:MAG: hypothetical protein DMG06_25850 [Acidobacteria bacterium]|nr:MAG: hypothetical protein DMG06_25850 [Acidobacteriota bacterium]
MEKAGLSRISLSLSSLAPLLWTKISEMALAKLTETGAVQAIHSWARPEVYEGWLAHLGQADYQAIIAAMNQAIDNRDVVRAN